MLTIKFFSLIREALDTEKLVLAIPEPDCSLKRLKHVLVAQHGESWEPVLFHPNVVHAVNQRVVDTDWVLQADDEVAFFPPMTGG